MKTNELRIGNLVNHIRKGVIVIGIMELDFIEKEVLDIEPIPLTEEWLLNLGFKKYTYWRPNNLDYYHSDLKEFCIISGQVRLCTDDPYEFFKIPQNIQFVHQLQNLYFALTGEELTIDKEKTK